MQLWRTTILHITIILLGISSSITAQAQKDNHFLLSKKNKIEIPFDFINGFIVVKAELNQKHKVNLLVDTGAENLILFNEAIKEEMQLPPGKKITLRGADLMNDISAEIVRNIKFKISDSHTVNKDFIVLDKNEMNLDATVGQPIDGLLGGRTFWRMVLEIDYRKQKLILRDKSSFTPPYSSDYEVFDLEVHKNKPYITAQVNMYSGGSIPIKVLLDTGASLGFMLFYNTHPDLYLPDQYIEGKLGRGLGGPILGYISKCKMVKLGAHLYFKDLLTNFQGQNLDVDVELYNDRNALIGNPILSRFHIIIDYVEQKLYLRPNKKYNRALEYDKSGIVLLAAGQDLDRYIVNSLIKGSSAEAASIQEGDEILRVNLMSRKLLSLGDINRKLSGKQGKKIKLLIKRDGKKLKKTFLLKEYLVLSQKPHFLFN